MPTVRFTPILGKRIRVTKLGASGQIPASATADSFLATDGFVRVNISAEVEDGTEIVTKKADGTYCVNEKQANSLKRLNLEIEFCGVNPALLGLVSNAEGYADYAGDIAGITIPEGAINKKFALELWTGLDSSTVVASGDEGSGYLLLPYVNAGTIGDLSADGENALNVSMTGAYTKGGNSWGVGPYDVVKDDLDAAAPLPTALDALDHLLLLQTMLAPPASNDDLQAMPA